MWLILIRVNRRRLLVVFVGKCPKKVRTKHLHCSFKNTLLNDILRGLRLVKQINYFNQAFFFLLLELWIFFRIREVSDSMACLELGQVQNLPFWAVNVFKWLQLFEINVNAVNEIRRGCKGLLTTISGLGDCRSDSNLLRLVHLVGHVDWLGALRFDNDVRRHLLGKF